VLAPIAPALGGNGLSMRVAEFAAAATSDFEVTVAVVPVAGRTPVTAVPAVPTVLVRGPSGEPVGPAMARLVADPAWRARLAAAPFPEMARRAPPTMARAVCRAAGTLGDLDGAPVHVIRSYLAPLGLAVAEQLGSPWVTLDLDDDDEAFSLAGGKLEDAAAFGRLIAAFGPSFAGLAAASLEDAGALRERHGLDVTILPNSVRLPAGAPRRRQRTHDLLFVGNLRYPPNATAARLLVDQLLPAIRRRSDLPVTATIAGPYGADETVAALATHPGVRVLGFVPDLGPLYDRAAVAVVPLQTGSGTKIKVLEAFAHRVPVVTTPAGAAGLAVTRGIHLLVGEDPSELVSHTLTLLADEAAAGRLAAAAFEYVRLQHTPEATGRLVQRFLRAAAARAARSAAADRV
jgi:polysaccharide biosynthesis protein PslH